MGNRNAQPDPAASAAAEPQLPGWIKTLQTCPKVDLAVWEDHTYTGGSLHPAWSVQLLICEESRLWKPQVRTVDLKSLDPVVVGSTATRLDPGSLIARMAEYPLFTATIHSMEYRSSSALLGLEVKDLCDQYYGTPSRPYALGADACVDLAKYTAQKLDQHRYNYQLTSVAQAPRRPVLLSHSRRDSDNPDCTLTPRHAYARMRTMWCLNLTSGRLHICCGSGR